jgi:hypothetical protein
MSAPDSTSNLKLPYLAAAQAQKHVTHNEALNLLDVLVQLAVLGRRLVEPPATPGEGDRHIVAASATGGWSGKSGQIAVWSDGGWDFLTPREGWTAWVADEALFVTHRSGDWSPSLPALRERLSGARTYYVRTDGSDLNDGLSNTPSGGFLTLQRAVTAVQGLDIGPHSVTIRVADGSYPTGVSIAGPWLGSGTVTITGNTAAPGSVVLTGSGANCISASFGARVSIEGMEFRTIGGGSAIVASGGAICTISGPVRFGACATYHMLGDAGGTIQVNAGYQIVGGALYHWIATTRGGISCVARAVALSGAPAFGAAFAYAGRLGGIDCHLCTFSGTATGIRYAVDGNSVLFTNGGGASYLPGSSAGSASSGGQYV